MSYSVLYGVKIMQKKFQNILWIFEGCTMTLKFTVFTLIRSKFVILVTITHTFTLIKISKVLLCFLVWMFRNSGEQKIITLNSNLEHEMIFKIDQFCWNRIISNLGQNSSFLQRFDFRIIFTVITSSTPLYAMLCFKIVKE